MMNVVERYVLFWAMLFFVFVFVFIATFKNQELSVNIQIPSIIHKNWPEFQHGNNLTITE